MLLGLPAPAAAAGAQASHRLALPRPATLCHLATEATQQEDPHAVNGIWRLLGAAVDLFVASLVPAIGAAAHNYVPRVEALAASPPLDLAQQQ